MKIRIKMGYDRMNDRAVTHYFEAVRYSVPVIVNQILFNQRKFPFKHKKHFLEIEPTVLLLLSFLPMHFAFGTVNNNFVLCLLVPRWRILQC